MREAGALTLVLALLGGGCTLLTKFDPEKQKCDESAPTVEEQCLAGFRCEMGKCVEDDSGPADGG